MTILEYLSDGITNFTTFKDTFNLFENMVITNLKMVHFCRFIIMFR